jgi:transposase
MRGDERVQGVMFATVVLEDRIPAAHPLRDLRRLVDPILRDLSPTFDALYSGTGRPSIPPEQLLRALLLQVLYSIRSERQLVEHLEYNLLYRWFVGLDLEASAWHATTFTKNRQRLLDGAIAGQFLARVVGVADASALISREHFSVDGTLLEAWASQKSVRPLDEDDRDRPVDPDNTGVSFHGERRTNATHRSVTDPDARMARKSNNTASILGYQASVLTENRHGLVLGALVSSPHGVAEAEDAVVLLQGVPLPPGQATVGADKGYDTALFVEGARALGVTPHVAAKTKGGAIDGRTTRHAGYAVSQRKRKAIEEVFGWLKTVAGLRKLRHRGTALVDWLLTFACAAYNLVRLRRLLAA